MTTEKLFGMVKGHREHIADNTGRLYSDGEICDLLNEQDAEIKRLQDDIFDWKESAKDYHKIGQALYKENKELKQVLGSILIEVRRDISATNHSGEVKAFVNPNSFDLISNVLKKYGALKDWYE